MKLIVLYLLAVCCYSLANTSQQTIEQRKLREILKDLNGVQKSLQHSEMMLNTPQNIGDHCSVSALKCFQEELEDHFNMSKSEDRTQKRFFRSLGRQSKRISSLQHNTILKPHFFHPFQVSAVKLGEQGSAASNCTKCNEYPKENVAQFFEKMKSLIQMVSAIFSADLKNKQTKKKKVKIFEYFAIFFIVTLGKGG
ncbi:interleukin-21-like [Thunnus thynnus]|uniref:interleukin-21-like n=1 Tax=Thunnus thynnus TaxID=8237 RepID=UPI003527EE14